MIRPSIGIIVISCMLASCSTLTSTGDHNTASSTDTQWAPELRTRIRVPMDGVSTATALQTIGNIAKYSTHVRGQPPASDRITVPPDTMSIGDVIASIADQSDAIVRLDEKKRRIDVVYSSGK